MVSSILIYHPLGLGDHIVCNGLVREQCKRYDRVGLYCFKRNEPSISFMYRDVKNLRLQVIYSQNEIKRFFFWYRLTFGDSRYDSLLHVRITDAETGVKYERQFYNSAGLSLATLWESFFVERDEARENSLSQKVHLPDRYIFLHDDARFPIDSARISSSLPIMRPDAGLTDNIFDYCGVIEHAEEIHVMDSSFMFLVDCLPYTNPQQRLFVHRYARDNMPWSLPILKKDWKIIL